MKVLLSGARGFIGSALAEKLTATEHSVGRLVRPGTQPGPLDVAWDPAGGRIDAQALEGYDAVVHLAGESISGRWTAAKKARIRDSRILGTALLCGALAGLKRPPTVLASASGIGFYGSGRGEALTEGASPGEGFMAELCVEWEAATAPAAEAGIRVVNLRTALVLSPAGGALKEMLPAFRLGLGGRIGSGRQTWSWISLEDTTSAILHVLNTGSVRGPVNLAAPQAVTNREFTKALGRALGRWAFLPVPGFAARLAFGEMANELLLASARVEPRTLAGSGFRFQHPSLEAALRQMLG